MQYAPGDCWLHQAGGGQTCGAVWWRGGYFKPPLLLLCLLSGVGGQLADPFQTGTLDPHRLGTSLSLTLFNSRRHRPAPAASVERGDAHIVPRQLLLSSATSSWHRGEGRLRGEGHVCRHPPPAASSVAAAETGSVSQASTFLLCFGGTDGVSFEHNFETEGLILLSSLLFLNDICGWENQKAATQRLHLHAEPCLRSWESLSKG